MLQTTDNNISLDQLSPQQLSQLRKMVVMDGLKEELKKSDSISSFLLDDKIDMWLSRKAQNTKRMYKQYMELFISSIDCHILSVDAYVIDAFISDKLSSYNSSKAKGIFSAISSFFSDLVRWGDVPFNPCKGANTKMFSHGDYVERKEVPGDDDYMYYLMYFDKNTVAHKKMRLALHMMFNYGVRISFLDKNVISVEGNNIHSFSKGKKYNVSVREGDGVDLKHITELNPNTIATNFKAATKYLYENKLIGKKYSPHDLRHSFACREYLKDKDILRVSRLLRHSNVLITQTYLRGMIDEIR